MSAKKILTLLLTVSLFGNTILMYRLFDVGITLTHQKDERQRKAKQFEDIKTVFMTVCSSKMSSSKLVRESPKTGLEIILKDDGVYIGEVFFEFSGDKIIDVD